MKLDNRTAGKLKEDFPIFANQKNLVYLDNAATSQKPAQVINSVKEYCENFNSNVDRGLYPIAEKATEKYADARKEVAGFINASPEEIVFTKNSTDSLNMLSYSLPSIIKKRKNEILLTEMEHHSNLIPWQQLCKRTGMRLKFIKMKNNFELDLEDARKKISKKTAILSFTHVSNSLGTVNPAKELAAIGKEKGAIVVIDAAQSVPHMKIDARELGCDFLVFSGHKMLASSGVGVLFGKREILEKMSPFEFGGGMIKAVSYENAIWANSPERFEAGTPNVEGAISLGEAIKYLRKIGMENIEKWEKTLLKYAREKLSEIPGLMTYCPALENSSGILSFNLGNVHPHDVASLLGNYGISIRAGHHCNMPLMKRLNVSGTCRISFCLYSTFEDIDALTESLEKIREKFE